MPTRRDFLAGTVGVVGATALPASAAPFVQTSSSTASSQGRVLGANDRVRVGVIGTGRQGTGVMRGHQRLADVEIAAICDVYAPNLAKAAEVAPEPPRSMPTSARILDDKNIDAVVIGTPDHWHALMTVLACQAGKDVYVEKPTSVAIAEGRAMVQAARKYNRIVQVGTQQRSQPHFQQAAEIVQERRPRRRHRWSAAGTPPTPEGIGNPPDGAPPEGLDWDLWLGPAQKVPFNPNRFGVVPDALVALPLVLGLRRRHDDRLGRAPHRHRADGDERRRAARGVDDRRQVPPRPTTATRRTRSSPRIAIPVS